MKGHFELETTVEPPVSDHPESASATYVAALTFVSPETFATSSFKSRSFSKKENNKNSVALSRFEIPKRPHCTIGFPPYCWSSRLKPRSARNFCKRACPSWSYDRHMSIMFDWSSHSQAPFAGKRRFSKSRGLSGSVFFLPLPHFTSLQLHRTGIVIWCLCPFLVWGFRSDDEMVIGKRCLHLFKSSGTSIVVSRSFFAGSRRQNYEALFYVQRHGTHDQMMCLIYLFLYQFQISDNMQFWYSSPLETW